MSEQTTIRHIFYDWCKETYLEPTEARFEAFESGYARAGRSPAPAEGGEGELQVWKRVLPHPQDGTSDLRYLYGLAIMRSRSEDGEGLREALREANEAIRELQQEACNRAGVPMPSQRSIVDRLREALVRIEIITASGRTDELLGKMKTINSLAHAALAQPQEKT